MVKFRLLVPFTSLFFVPFKNGFNAALCCCIHIHLNFYRPQMKFEAHNVFTPVCHSVHRVGVSVPVCITGHMTWGSHIPRGRVSDAGGGSK